MTVRFANSLNCNQHCKNSEYKRLLRRRKSQYVRCTMDDQIDYLWKQKVLLNLFGVFPATPCVTNRVRIGRAVYSKCVLLLLMHMFALFGITAVKDCMYNSLAEIMYSALQTLLLFHMTFIASYYQYFADEIFDLLSFANRIARQRSAPGKCN